MWGCQDIQLQDLQRDCSVWTSRAGKEEEKKRRTTFPQERKEHIKPENSQEAKWRANQEIRLRKRKRGRKIEKEETRMRKENCRRLETRDRKIPKQSSLFLIHQIVPLPKN